MMSMAISVGSLVLATAWGGTLYAWDSFQIVGLFVLCIVAALVFVQIERRAKGPHHPPSAVQEQELRAVHHHRPHHHAGHDGHHVVSAHVFPDSGPAFSRAGRAHDRAHDGGRHDTAIGTGFLATKTGRYKWMPIARDCLVMAVAFLLLSRMAVGTPLLVTGAFLFVLGFGIGLGQ